MVTPYILSEETLILRFKKDKVRAIEDCMSACILGNQGIISRDASTYYLGFALKKERKDSSIVFTTWLSIRKFTEYRITYFS